MEKFPYFENAKGNQLIKRVFLLFFTSMFGDCFLHVTGSLVDTAMAGVFFDLKALAGVGICGLYVNMVMMVSGLLTSGFSTQMTNALGRGDVEGSNRAFSCGVQLNIAINLLLVAVSFAIPGQMVAFFGARDPEIARYAAGYLKINSIAMLMAVIDTEMRYIMLAHGFRKEAFIKSLIQTVFNFGSSLFFVLVLDLGVSGLAWGSAVGAAVSFFYQLICYLRRPTTVHLYLFPSRKILSEVGGSLKYSIPSTVNSVGDFGLGVLLNNIVASSGIPNGLTILTLYQSVRLLTRCTNSAGCIAIKNIGSALFGAHDADGIRALYKNALVYSSLAGVVITTLILCLNRPVLSVFGANTPEITAVILPAFLWLIVTAVVQPFVDLLRELYSAQGRAVIASVCAVGADFVVYILLVALLLPAIGISATWIGYALCFPLFALIWTVIIRLKLKRTPRTIDDWIMLPKDFYDEDTLFVVSLQNGIEDFAKVAEIESFLTAKGVSKKDAYRTQLCIEEIVARISEGKKLPKYVDLRVFIRDNRVHFSVRDSGPMNNRLVFEPKDEMDGVGIRIVRAVASKVEFSYMVGINVLNVEL